MARRLLSLFVGVPEEMLRSTGLIVVLCSQLDHIRMQIIEAADQVPVTTSADWSRRRLTEALISAYAEPLFEPLRQQLATWLEEGESLFDFRDDLVHSVWAYETRGDGSKQLEDIHAEQQRSLEEALREVQADRR